MGVTAGFQISILEVNEINNEPPLAQSERKILLAKDFHRVDGVDLLTDMD
jgi:hypothetical protein